MELIIVIIVAVIAVGAMLFARSAQKSNAALQQQLTSLQQRLSESERISAQSSAVLGSKDTEIQRLQARSKELEAELRNTTERLSEKSALTASLQTELKSKSESLQEQSAENVRLQESVKALSDEILKLRTQNGTMKERIETIQEETRQLHKSTTETFENAARKIIAQSAQETKTAHSERLEEILNPFKENLMEFKSAVEKAHLEDTSQRKSLDDRMRELAEANKTIGREAKELTNALRSSSKSQGDWGELVLQDILEKSGLQEGIHFETQVSRNVDGKTMVDEEGKRKRMDVVLHLPDKREIIIDSKTSLTDYTTYINATEDEVRDNALKAHIQSVRKHIDELAAVDYQSHYDGASDFVMMFIPHEGAYNLAMQSDAQLWKYAYDKRIVIVGPTSLVTSLRLINQLWQHDKQTKNAVEIARVGGRLYDKIVGFVSDIEDIHSQIEKVDKSYNAAMTKLQGTGGMMSTADKLRKLGAKISKVIPDKFLPEEEQEQ